MTATRDDFLRAFRDLGLGRHSHVLVHSAYGSLGAVEGGPGAVVRALVDSFATVMMPAFTAERTSAWDARGAVPGNAYPSERPADWQDPEPFTDDTPANRTMGVVSETFRTSFAVQRSPNPLVSFIAYGALAEQLVGESEYEGVEPIRRLMEAGGDVLLLGVTHTSSTSIHLGEQLAGRELFVRYALTPGGVREVRAGGCGAGFNEIQAHVQHLERRAQVGSGVLRCYALQPYVGAAEELVRRDPFALLCDACERCAAHRSRVPA